MIVKKMLMVASVLPFLIGCGASDDIEQFIEDTKEKYFEEELAGVVESSGAVDSSEESNISISGQEQALLNLHNAARASVGVDENVTWSDQLEVDARSYAETIAQSGVWEHDPKNFSGYSNGPYGENLYTSTARPTLADAAEAWINEERYYTYGAIGDESTCEAGQMCGHYTQIVWKDTTEVGCATSKYTTGQYKDWYVIVCKYKTPGNYIGETPY